MATGIWSSVPFPPTAIAEAIIRATPGDIATFFIETFGPWALRLLTIGTVLATTVLAGLTFRVLRGRIILTSVVLGAAVAISVWISPARDVKMTELLAVVVVMSSVFALSVRGSQPRPEPEPDSKRRRLIRLGFGGAATLVVGGGVVGWFARRFSGPDTNVALMDASLPATVPARGAWPDIAGLTPEVTSVKSHYTVDINLFDPTVEAEGWSLEVMGAVREPLSLGFNALQERFEIVEEYSVLTCVSNEVGGNLVGHSAWQGVRLADVLEAAGPDGGSVDVALRAADGYSDSIPLAIARDPSVLIAVAQNGKPLTQEHGFPARLRVPAIYGMKNVKWLTEIEVMSKDYDGYWQIRGWSDDATVRTQSRIDVAGADGVAKVGEKTWIAGVAWAGSRGLSKVEVSMDEGKTWVEARLRDEIADDSWRQWAYEWTPERAGRIEVMCRATDGQGDTQTPQTAPPHPAGATGWHSVDVEVS